MLLSQYCQFYGAVQHLITTGSDGGYGMGDSCLLFNSCGHLRHNFINRLKTVTIATYKAASTFLLFSAERRSTGRASST